MKTSSTLFMQGALMVVFLASLPRVATSQASDTLFSDRSTFLSGPRAPACSGPEENGCNCENSQYRCRDPDSAVVCPSNPEAGCVTTVEGDPICATGGGKECSASSECDAGEACIYVGRISHSLCSGLLEGRQVCATRVV
ncbi:hypothetical protein FisN_1Hh011 [Fistulifera solaris]|uniref:Uncharacterized protein n=1 Tax=Fistulifera solaris TaxID=1519565 RepID=A0A1Z5KSL9_FISSO|nr:hypothetical protein FisN_1Hh011 [Fistulifera solaris]|eukprot:GAX28991.1 hypothetical protein FisN_1Hh011 [Fistulifera solaris]